MKLIIAEKPSVARAIAEVVGATDKKAGYREGNGYLVSWAIGHLVGLEDATAYGDFAKWRIEDLPIIPDKWLYGVSANTANQYDILNELMHRSDVDSLVSATDAGREGELIFRLIYNQTGCNKPFERLWASSLEEKDLKAALDNLRPGSDYDNLYQAALLRQQADWIVGINYSRFISCMYRHTLSVGRVQTPVLQMIANRQHEISSFVPEPYYILTTRLGDMTASTRVTSKRQMEEVVERCKGQEAAITLIAPEEHTAKAPPLFCLSSLQGEANSRYGFTAQQTLTIAQALYEKQLITYPRTSSSYIPDSIQETMSRRLHNLALQPKLKAVVDELLSKPLPLIADNNKIADHHAIIPTMTANPMSVELTVEERTVFDLVCSRTAIALSEPYQYTTVTVTWDIAGEAFKTVARTVTQPGWKGVEHSLLSPADDDEQPELVEQTLSRPISQDETYICSEIDAKAKKTQPPKAYTDRTLIEAMKNVGRRIGNEELRLAIAGGLGTEATRASIIERLIAIETVKREKKSLVITDKGNKLLMAIPWNEVKDAEMTAEWELMLTAVEQGEMDSDTFLSGITKNVANYINISKEFGNTEPYPDIEFNNKIVVGGCPCCHGNVLEGKKNFYCENKDFAMWREDAFWLTKGKALTTSIAKELLAGNSVELTNCTSKNGHKYNAKVKLDGAKEGRAQYGMTFIAPTQKTTKQDVKHRNTAR